MNLFLKYLFFRPISSGWEILKKCISLEGMLLGNTQFDNLTLDTWTLAPPEDTWYDVILWVLGVLGKG